MGTARYCYAGRQPHPSTELCVSAALAAKYGLCSSCFPTGLGLHVAVSSRNHRTWYRFYGTNTLWRDKADVAFGDRRYAWQCVSRCIGGAQSALFVKGRPDVAAEGLPARRHLQMRLQTFSGSTRRRSSNRGCHWRANRYARGGTPFRPGSAQVRSQDLTKPFSRRSSDITGGGPV